MATVARYWLCVESGNRPNDIRSTKGDVIEREVKSAVIMVVMKALTIVIEDDQR